MNKKEAQLDGKIRAQAAKAVQNLCYFDDEFFNACLQKNTDAALLILRIVMRMPDLTLTKEPETQKSVKNLRHKSIRFDLFAESMKKYCAVEIQRADAGADPHRARYYSSLLDAGISVEGEEYSHIADTYVIFITENDVLGKSRPYYDIDRWIDREDAFKDGSHIIYINGSYEGDDDFGKLMHDFRCVNPDDMYYDELREPALFYKRDEEGVKQMSTTVSRMMDELKDEIRVLAREEGLREGERRGHSAGLREGERKGRAVGRSEGEDRFASLVNALVSAGRMDDVKKASTDDVYRQKLYKEFKL